MTRQQQAEQAVQQSQDWSAKQSQESALQHLCDNEGTAHIYRISDGFELLATDGPDIYGAITVGTYSTKQHAKRVAAQLGLRAHNY
jgi:hypothetical protein